MKKFYLIIYCFLISFYIKAEANYIVEVHGTIKEVNTHKYTETDNLKFLTIDGTFKDNLGNFISHMKEDDAVKKVLSSHKL